MNLCVRGEPDLQLSVGGLLLHMSVDTLRGNADGALFVCKPGSADYARRVKAGIAWESWPLAVRQLVFDSMQDEFTQSRRGDLAANYIAAEAVREYNGSFAEMDDALQDELLDVSQGLVDREIEAGTLPEGSTEAIPEALNRWRDVADEMGYADEGTFANYDEWYDTEDTEYLVPFGERYFEEVMLPHRPS